MTQKHEKEFEGPIWKHPYMVYIWLTMILFTVLLIVTWIAFSSGMIPNRGGV